MERSRRLLLLLFLLPLVAGALNAADRPNILWLTAEDMSPNVGAYGDPDARTPTLDRLAADGVRYERAFAVAGVCAPSRSSLIAGMYASSLGSQHMRCEATLPAAVQLLPALLRDAGYYCTNNFKQDYNFAAPEGAWDESSRTAHWRNRPAGRPFFSVFNFMTTHEQFLRAEPAAVARAGARIGPADRRDPAGLSLPGWLPDTPAVRREWARYHENITAMDLQVAAVLRQLEEDGLAGDTIVMFFSDHGAGFPRAKQFIYDCGMRVPLIVHCPPRWRHLLPMKAGTADSRLVSLVDLAPSVLGLAGVTPPTTMQGRAFLGKAASAPRAYTYGIRDRMDERFDTSRTVRDARFRYHRNYRPDLPHFPGLTYMDMLATAQEFRRLAAAGQLTGGLAHFMAPKQGLEELYDLDADPDELHNLAADPAYAADLQRLRMAHFAWVRETRDTGFIPEQMLRDFAEGSSEFEYARSEKYQLDRCVATARLMEEGRAAVPALTKALDDDYAPVRYWAAVGLGVLGTDAASALPALKRALTDRHAEVALAAAEALCRAGQPQPALPVIAHWLEKGRAVEALAAGNVADRIGAQGRPIADVMRRVAIAKPEGDLGLMRQWVVLHALRTIDTPWTPPEDGAPLTDVGVASVDITPRHPIRLHAFPRGERVKETSTIAQRIHAQALAIGNDAQKPVVLLTTDLLGISEEMSVELARRLAERAGLKDRARLTFTATHNHSAPAVTTMAPYVFRQEPEPAHAESIARYGEWLMDRLEEVVHAALADRRPAHVHFVRGQAGFAVNRRVLKNGRMVGFGINPEGEIDHEVPLLAVRAPDGALRAVWLSYACHGVCWRKNAVHGDWMGVARQLIETEHPGARALITIGCAGDQNPEVTEGDDAATPGREIAVEVNRLLAQPGRPLPGVPATQLRRFDIPLEPVPPPAYWANQKDWYGRTVQAQLKEGRSPRAAAPFVVQSWSFASDFSVVFLSGEVFAGYGLRLKRELGADRLWVNAYANAMPGYIPTARTIPEGGWEIDDSRRNYGLPSRVAPEAEEIIVRAVHEIVPKASRASP